MDGTPRRAQPRALRACLASLASLALLGCPALWEGRNVASLQGVVALGHVDSGLVLAVALPRPGAAPQGPAPIGPLVDGRFGGWVALPDAGFDGLVLIEIRQAQYVDPATGATRGLGSSHPLRAIVESARPDAVVDGIVVTPLTTFVADRVLAGDDLAAARSAAAALFGAAPLGEPAALGATDFGLYGDPALAHARAIAGLAQAAAALGGGLGATDLAAVLAGAPDAPPGLDPRQVLAALRAGIAARAAALGWTDPDPPGSDGAGLLTRVPTGARASCVSVAFARGRREAPDRTAYTARLEHDGLVALFAPLELEIDQLAPDGVELVDEVGESGARGVYRVATDLEPGQPLEIELELLNPSRSPVSFVHRVYGRLVPEVVVTDADLLLGFVEEAGSATAPVFRARATHVGSAPLYGPLRLRIANLEPDDARVLDAQGLPATEAELRLPGSLRLDPGESVEAPVRFESPSGARVRFTAQLLAHRSDPLRDLTGQVTLAVARDDAPPPGEARYEVRVVNDSSDALVGPLRLAIGDVAPQGAALLDADGRLPGCQAVVALPFERLEPGATSAAVTLAFADPGLDSLSFTTTLLGRLAPAAVAGAPVVTLLEPADGFRTAADEVVVRGEVDDPGASVSVSGLPVALVGGAFEATVALVEGANAIAIDAVGAGGLRGEARLTVVRDTAAPVIEITAPASGSSVALVQVPVLGRVIDGGPVTLEVGGQPVALDGASFQALVPLAPGPNAIELVATDDVGNRSSALLSLTRVVGDLAGPLILIESPEDGALVAQDEVALTGRLVDAGALDATTPLTLNGEPVALLGERFAIRVALAEGANALVLVARDALGNESSATLEVVRDSVAPDAPTIAAVEPASPTRAARVVVTGTGEAGALVRIEGGAAAASARADAGGGFALEVFLRLEQENRLLVTARDAAGNTGPASELTVRQDATPPDVAILAPTGPDPIPEGTRPVLVRAVDASGIAALVVAGAAATPLGDGLYQAEIALAPGATTLVAQAEDGAGNVATASAAVDVEAGQGQDTAPPIVSIVVPDAGFVAATSVEVTGTVYDQSEIRAVTIAGADLVDATLAGDRFSGTVRIASAGATAIVVEATDAGDLVGTAQVLVEPDDGPPPAPAIDAVASPTRNPQIVVQGRAEGATEVRVEGGLAPATADVGGDGRFGALVDLVLDATQTLRVVAVDAVGNESPPVEREVVQDGVAPRVVATTPEAGTQGVAPDAAVEVTFDEAVDPASALAAVALEADGTPVAIDGALAAGDRRLRVLPQAALPSDASVTLRLAPTLTDRAGNPLAAAFALSFGTLDTQPPSAPVVSPAPPSATAAASVVLRGSAERDAAIAVAGGAASAAAVADAAGAFEVDVSLVADALNTLSVTASDAAGNTSPPTTAVVRQDSTPPTPSFEPAPGGLDVDPAATLRVSFGEA
ncbi:MAG: Ig-like domain-containing protein, partial [Myxococcota bacterium]|nr:Ig-like domain-containing protein [Myxococcota bacterium]